MTQHIIELTVTVGMLVASQTAADNILEITRRVRTRKQKRCGRHRCHELFHKCFPRREK
jgi:hypothetical protein